MKLIIDIPDHLYTVIKNKECTHRNVLTEAVYDGISLDEIKQEISDIPSFVITGVHSYDVMTGSEMRDRVFEIIDKYREGANE